MQNEWLSLNPSLGDTGDRLVWGGGHHAPSYCLQMCICTDESERTKQSTNNWSKEKMKKFILPLIVVSMTLTACGVNTSEHQEVVAERDKLVARVAKLEKSLKEVSATLATTKRDLETEIKVKKQHAVREEQAKQRLLQAERDLATAMTKLKSCQQVKKK